MKKSTLLSTMLLILVLAFPVAAEVNITGEIQPGFITNFSDYAIPTFASSSEFAFNAKADDFTTVNLTLTVVDSYISGNELGGDALGLYTTGYSDVPTVRYLYFTTDLLGAVGLGGMGVDVSIMAGYFRPQNERYALSNLALERIYSFRNPATAVDIVVSAMDKMINFEFIFNEQVFYASESVTSIDNKPGNQLWFGAYGGIAPIWAELYYYTNKDPDFKGQIGAAVKFAMDIVPDTFKLSALANFKYDLAAAEANLDGAQYALGGAVRADIMKMAYISASYAGNDLDIFNVLYFEAGAGYNGMVGVDADLILCFADTGPLGDPSSMQAIEGSIWAMLGKANKFRLGYLYIPDDLIGSRSGQISYNNYVPVAPAKGGMFMRWDVKF